jgi:hypothetical protein
MNFCKKAFESADLAAKLYELDQGVNKDEICNLRDLNSIGNLTCRLG